MKINARWRKFIADFRTDTFWYFPHWLVDKPELVDILGVYAEFDDRRWSDSSVLKRLRQESLTQGTGAGPRMMRKAMENLGLCWLDDHILRITPAGRALVGGADKGRLLERLLWRYWLPNPINETPNVRLFPHAALLRMLLALGGKITRDEFILFAGHTATDDVGGAVDQITAWRALTPVLQENIIGQLGGRFRALRTDAGYSLGFHRCATYLKAFKDEKQRQGIRLVAKRRTEVEALLAAHDLRAHHIDYLTMADCIAAYGDIEAGSDLDKDVDYYLDTSQIDKAVAAFAELPVSARGGRTVEEFQDAAFLEKDLEDFVEKHLDTIEPGLQLEGKGRQYGTIVGPIDILARAANGDLVVIELKKVRASDKVFGQICRYMGCVAQHHAASGQAVRGFIVGSEIDDKLRYAARVVGEPTIRLKRFRRDDASPNIFIEDGTV